MIVDVHTHTPAFRGPVPPDRVVVNTVWRPDRPVVAATSWADHEAARTAAGVDVSVVFGIAVEPGESLGLPGDPTSVNDDTAAFVAADPAHRIGFLSVRPDDPEVLAEIERCVGDLGLRGLKLAPNYQQFDPLGNAACGVYAVAESRGLPIVFHQGTSPVRSAPLRYTHPLAMDEIAIRFPELRVVMAHMGHPWQADTIAIIRKHPHVYADISAGFVRPWSFYSAMRLATEWGVLEKLLFGSDFPIFSPAETAAGLRRVNEPVEGTRLPRVPLDQIERIIERDSLALLGLEQGAQAISVDRRRRGEP
jgi:predicted TIM-barrel fold metal-dependent hydrolase